MYVGSTVRVAKEVLLLRTLDEVLLEFTKTFAI